MSAAFGPPFQPSRRLRRQRKRPQSEQYSQNSFEAEYYLNQPGAMPAPPSRCATATDRLLRGDAVRFDAARRTRGAARESSSQNAAVVDEQHELALRRAPRPPLDEVQRQAVAVDGAGYREWCLCAS